MPSTAKQEWPITARGRKFSEDEAKVFNHAIKLAASRSGGVAMVAEGRARGLCHVAVPGPFRIELTIINDGPRQRRVEIDIAYEGKPVMQAAYEQWRRPHRRRELSVLCEVPTFIRGDWETALMRLT